MPNTDGKFLLYLFRLLQPLDLSIFYCFSNPMLPGSRLRDSKGRFRTPNQEEIKPIIPLSLEILK
jgi:hypothetical protein